MDLILRPKLLPLVQKFKVRVLKTRLGAGLIDPNTWDQFRVKIKTWIGRLLNEPMENELYRIFKVYESYGPKSDTSRVEKKEPFRYSFLSNEGLMGSVKGRKALES